MKRLPYILLVCAAAAFGCSKGDDPSVAGTLSISVGVEGVASKAIIDDSAFPSGAEIGVMALDASSLPYLDQSGNIKYTSDGSSPQGWSSAAPLKLSYASATIYAYYPYSDAFLGGGTSATVPVYLPAEASWGSEADYMYAYAAFEPHHPAASKTAPSVSLMMRHALSKVTFKFYLSDGAAPTDLTQIAIRNGSGATNIKVDSSNDIAMNIADGTITGGTAGTLVRTGTLQIPATAVSAETAVSVSTLAYPIATATAAAGDVAVTFTLGLNPVSLNIPAGTFWPAGTNTTYTLKITPSDIQLTTSSFSAWSTNTGVW